MVELVAVVRVHYNFICGFKGLELTELTKVSWTFEIGHACDKGPRQYPLCWEISFFSLSLSPLG
jgi:hypothetical protein